MAEKDNKLKIKVLKIVDAEHPVWVDTCFKISEGEKVLFEETFQVAEEDLLNLKKFMDCRIGKKDNDFYRSSGTVLIGGADDFEPQSPNKIFDLDHNYYLCGDPKKESIEIGFYNNDPKNPESIKDVYKIKLEVSDLNILAENLALDLDRLKIK